MLKRYLFTSILFFFTLAAIFGQAPVKNQQPNKELIDNFSRFSVQKLSDTAYSYLLNNSFDTAMVCYSLLINSPVKNNNAEFQRTIAEAYNRAAIIHYYYMCDYRSSYDYLIKGLLLCEKTNNLVTQAKIYANIGNIYYHFGRFDIAKLYYSDAQKISQDSCNIVILLSTLSTIELEIGSMDSASLYINKALEISKRHNNFFLSGIQSNIALMYQKNKQYDLALSYYHLALEESRRANKIDYETETLSDIAKLFFEIKKIDSAIHYINLSNKLADEIHFLRIKSYNYLTLSKIEESKGKIKNAFELYKKYVELNDSMFNPNIFVDINQLQRLYEMSKTNQQIEQLIIEQEIKERTNFYQKIILIIMLCILLFAGGVLLYIYLQKKNLNKAYKILFEKNLEIIGLQETSTEKTPKKSRKGSLSSDIQNELMDKILLLMEETAVICDPKFSIDKLAELVQSNQNYVSQTINQALNKNFRSFLNSYRIREAQRIFSQPDAQRYTIEFVTQQVGFKSISAFYDAFKEITGVTPKFYIQSLQARNATGARG
ncbi:MAG: helix-turn-helix domain-containing protein [Lentimicrobiaceae bacterium]|nr:helix-turn-helix domain-containing protein [Lentimicrobiaceae bacterium]